MLLIELYILINQPKAALSLVNYFDNQFISVDVSKTTNVEKDGSIKLLKVVNDAVTEAFKVKLSKCRARIYLMLQQLQKSNWENLAFLESTQVFIIFCIPFLCRVQNAKSLILLKLLFVAGHQLNFIKSQF